MAMDSEYVYATVEETSMEKMSSHGNISYDLKKINSNAWKQVQILMVTMQWVDKVRIPEP